MAYVYNIGVRKVFLDKEQKLPNTKKHYKFSYKKLKNFWVKKPNITIRR